MKALIEFPFPFWSFQCSGYDDNEYWAWKIYQYPEAWGMYMVLMWALQNSEAGVVTVGGM
jgi:hypothetical protein